MRRAILVGMYVTEADIAAIPRTNLRVPVAEFAAVWIEAERQDEANGRHGDWYATGVLVTCRWIARATVRPGDGRRSYLARSPVTERQNQAYEELIEAEHIEADKLDMRPPAWLTASRPGWTAGICATFRWAWARTGPAPLTLPSTATA